MIHSRWSFPVISVVLGVILISGTFLLFAGGGGSSTQSSAVRPVGSAVRGTPAPEQSATPASAASVTATPGPQRSYASAPPFTIDPAAIYIATIATDKGNIVIQLDARAAP